MEENDELKKAKKELERKKIELEYARMQKEIDEMQNKLNQETTNKISKKDSIKRVKEIINSIFVCSIVSIILLFVGIIFLIVFIKNFESNSWVIIFSTLFTLSWIASGILAFICSIRILASNFVYEEINSIKLLWGLLSLLLLGAIGSLIFSIISQSKLKQIN